MLRLRELRSRGDRRALPRSGELFRLGYGYYTHHRFDRARVVFELMDRISPKNPLPSVLLGRMEESESNVKKAAQHYQHALSLDPTNVSAKSALQRLRH